MRKKAQAAMEFLMTYGWAILVVLIAIAALTYFGILNPGRFMPASCTFDQPGLSCSEFKVTTNSVTLVIRNGMGKDMNNVNVSVTGCGSSAGDGTLTDGELETFTINCGSSLGSVGSRFKTTIAFTYTSPVSEGGLQHTINGQLATKIE